MSHNIRPTDTYSRRADEPTWRVSDTSRREEAPYRRAEADHYSGSAYTGSQSRSARSPRGGEHERRNLAAQVLRTPKLPPIDTSHVARRRQEPDSNSAPGSATLSTKTMDGIGAKEAKEAIAEVFRALSKDLVQLSYHYVQLDILEKIRERREGDYSKSMQKVVEFPSVPELYHKGRIVAEAECNKIRSIHQRQQATLDRKCQELGDLIVKALPAMQQASRSHLGGPKVKELEGEINLIRSDLKQHKERQKKAEAGLLEQILSLQNALEKKTKESEAALSKQREDFASELSSLRMEVRNSFHQELEQIRDKATREQTENRQTFQAQLGDQEKRIAQLEACRQADTALKAQATLSVEMSTATEKQLAEVRRDVAQQQDNFVALATVVGKEHRSILEVHENKLSEDEAKLEKHEAKLAEIDLDTWHHFNDMVIERPWIAPIDKLNKGYDQIQSRLSVLTNELRDYYMVRPTRQAISPIGDNSRQQDESIAKRVAVVESRLDLSQQDAIRASIIDAVSCQIAVLIERDRSALNVLLERDRSALGELRSRVDSLGLSAMALNAPINPEVQRALQEMKSLIDRQAEELQTGLQEAKSLISRQAEDCDKKSKNVNHSVKVLSDQYNNVNTQSLAIAIIGHLPQIYPPVSKVVADLHSVIAMARTLDDELKDQKQKLLNLEAVVSNGSVPNQVNNGPHKRRRIDSSPSPTAKGQAQTNGSNSGGGNGAVTC